MCIGRRFAENELNIIIAKVSNLKFIAHNSYLISDLFSFLENTKSSSIMENLRTK